jgi:transposase-like protein
MAEWTPIWTREIMGASFPDGKEPMPRKARRFSLETKMSAVQRMLAGENVTALSREMNILRKDLYKWRAGFLLGGPAALRGPGRPRGVVDTEARGGSRAGTGNKDGRIAELEKKVRRQQAELDSIRQILRRARTGTKQED